MRKPTPNIMDELMPAKSETTELRAGLKWDYSQLGEAASEVMGHAIEIKRVEKRASEAIVEAGRHLIAVKQSLSHGQWEDWLQTEFAMSDRTARRMMAVAEQFDGKTDTVSVLGPSVLYLLAGDSVPEPAREAVIDLAKSGETVTKAQAQAVINQHKPSRPTPGERYLAGLPALNMTTPTATPAGTYSTPLGNLPKNPIEDWELEDIVEQAATEYYGSVTAAQGEEMAQQSRAHAGEYWAKLQRVLAPFDVSVERVEAAVAAAVERLVGERRALRPGSPEAKALAREIKAATWADRRGPVVEKGRGGERKTTQTASALTVDGDLTAADVQVLQPMPPTEPEMVPLAAVSRLGQVIGTALGAAATSPTVEAGIARARELLVTPTPPADDRRTRLSQYAAQFEATLAALRDWAQLTGRFTLTSEAERGLHRVLEATRSELAALNGQPHQVWGEETTI